MDNNEENYCSGTKKGQSFLLENRQFKIPKPNKRITNSIRLTLGYLFLRHTNLSIDNKTRKKYYFSKKKPNGFPMLVDPQWDRFSRVVNNFNCKLF